MKKLSKISLLFFIITATVYKASAQDGLDLNSVLQAGVADAKVMTEKYMEPAFVGFGYSMNSGWYNTGAPHKLLGFDITAGMSLAIIPNSAKTYSFNNADYTNVRLQDEGISSALVPTVFGENLGADDLPQLSFLDATDIDGDGITDEEVININAPTGIGIEEADWYPISRAAVPAPYAQIGIGLIKGTEIKLRIIPEQNFDGVTVGSFGFGVLHDVKQWVPGMSLLPFDLSGFFGYNRYNVSFLMDEANNQRADLAIGGTTLQGIISKKLAILTVYAGLGIMTTSTNFDMTGSFPVDFQDEPLEDPLSFRFSTGGARANIGARLKLLFLTVHAEYALQKYNTLTLGVGISVR